MRTTKYKHDRTGLSIGEIHWPYAFISFDELVPEFDTVHNYSVLHANLWWFWRVWLWTWVLIVSLCIRFLRLLWVWFLTCNLCLNIYFQTDDIRTKGKDLIQPGADMLKEQMVPLRAWVWVLALSHVFFF